MNSKTANPAIAEIAEVIIVDLNDIHDVLSRLALYKFDFEFAIIGPENPNYYGLTDVIESNGIPCITLVKYAQIECNKAAFCRELLEEMKPDFDLSPDFKHIRMPDDVIKFVNKHDGNVVVIKNTGLCEGKECLYKATILLVVSKLLI